MNFFYPFHHKGLQENLFVSAVLRAQGGARDVGATDYHITLEGGAYGGNLPPRDAGQGGGAGERGRGEGPETLRVPVLQDPGG